MSESQIENRSSETRNIWITDQVGDFSAYPPVTGDMSREKVCSPAVSNRLVFTDPDTHPTTKAIEGVRYYNITAGQAEVKADGSIIIHGLRLQPITTNWSKPVESTLREIWKSDAPFTYDYMVAELIRHNVLDEDSVWILYPVRGNHPTCSVHVRALYESLLSYNCIDELSFPGVQQIFNATFSTNIRCSKVIENKNTCIEEFEYFQRMFEAFANPDANADIE